MRMKVVFWGNESTVDLANEKQKIPEKTTDVSPDM